MKKDLTEIIFVIDRSGSMDSIVDDVIGGINSFIKKQLQELGDKPCKVSAYKFDDVYEIIFENVALSDVPLLTREDYQPRGSTALLDAIGKTIDDTGLRLHNTLEEDRPERVLVVIITDGYENASRRYTSEQVKEKIQHQTQVYSWDFAYIGANQDAWSVGSSYGFVTGSSLNYVANSEGVSDMFNTLSKSTTMYRCCSVKKSFGFVEEEE